MLDTSYEEVTPADGDGVFVTSASDDDDGVLVTPASDDDDGVLVTSVGDGALLSISPAPQ